MSECPHSHMQVKARPRTGDTIATNKMLRAWATFTFFSFYYQITGKLLSLETDKPKIAAIFTCQSVSTSIDVLVRSGSGCEIEPGPQGREGPKG